MRRMRLDRLLSQNGCSRKEAALLIRSGKVTVDGRPEGNPACSVDLDSARVCLSGAPLRTQKHIHLMLNKPAGVLTATEDARDRTVMDLLPPGLSRRGLGPVGRLDKDVTGLVLMTTDGQLAHRLISPRWEQDKRYIARVEGRVGEAEVRKMAEGIPLRDFVCKGARLTVLSANEAESVCEVIVTEGKYHQVKRMMGALSHPVIALERRSIAGVELDAALPPGGWRELTEEEKNHLYAITELEE